jgi:hypothetical protein
MRIEGCITEDDANRIIRYVEAVPITFPISSGEGISYDVERYCAFRQDAYHAEMAKKDDSVGLLLNARESRLKLLDSIDKYVENPARIYCIAEL